MTSPCDHVTTLDCHVLILSFLVFFICMSSIDRYIDRQTDRQTDTQTHGLRIERQDLEAIQQYTTVCHPLFALLKVMWQLRSTKEVTLEFCNGCGTQKNCTDVFIRPSKVLQYAKEIGLDIR